MKEESEHEGLLTIECMWLDPSACSRNWGRLVLVTNVCATGLCCNQHVILSFRHTARHNRRQLSVIHNYQNDEINCKKIPRV